MFKGGKFYLALLLVMVLTVIGLLKIKPIPWLVASEAQISGSVKVGEKEFVLEQVIVNNARKIQGFAMATDGGKIFFSDQEADTSLDQLGYLKGRMFGEEIGWIDFGVNKKTVLRIDDSGILSGTVVSSLGKDVVFNAKTSWRPFTLAEIQTPKVVQANVGSKTKIDYKILGLGGRDLQDVQLKWSSSNPNVKIDEDGYVEVDTAGDFDDVIVLSVGDQQKAITLEAQTHINTLTLIPDLAVAGDGTNSKKVSFKVTANPVTSLFPGDSVVALVREDANKDHKNRTDCIVKDTQTIECDLKDVSAGSWNLAMQLHRAQPEEYVFASVLYVVSSSSGFNFTMLSTVDSDDQHTVHTGNPVNYSAIVDWPGYLSDKKEKYYVSNYVVNSSLEGVGIVDNSCNGKIDTDGRDTWHQTPRILEKDFDLSVFDLTTNQINLNFLPIIYSSTLPVGCDLLAKVKLTLTFTSREPEAGNFTFDITGSSEVRNPIDARKQLSVEGDILVEQGDLQIQRMNKDKPNFYLLTAKDEVTGTDTNSQLSNYEIATGQNATYDEVIKSIKEKINKLVIERGEYFNLNNTSELGQFTKNEIRTKPEGRILYNQDDVGPVKLGDIEVCGPTTLVVQGRDVEVNGNITMKKNQFNPDVDSGSDTDPLCDANGSFGLIVLDGNIKFAGDQPPLPAVTDVNGFYFTTGTIFTGISHKKFTLSGVAVAHDYALQRY